MKKSKSIEETTFVVIDVETTGLSPVNNRITEIGLAKISRGEIMEEYSTLLNPKQFIPPSITRLTGITNEMVYNKREFTDIIPEIMNFLNVKKDEIILAGHNVSFDNKFLIASLKRASFKFCVLKTLCTCRLARRLNYNLKSKSLNNLINYFGIKTKKRHRALDDAKATAQILIHFLDKLLEDYHIESIDELLSFQFKTINNTPVRSDKLKKIKLELSKVPKDPGVYFMYNRKKEIIYIGKAKNLKERLSSYFYHNVSHTNKIIKMLRTLNSIDYITTSSELSALLLESKKIKEHKPKYNSANRRYRRYPFVKIDQLNTFPRILKTYEVKNDGARYFGPFKSSFTVDAIIEVINKNFKLRKCDDINLKPSIGKSPCIYFDIKQCEAPCNNSVNEFVYRIEVEKVDTFLTSQNQGGLLFLLQGKMNKLSSALNFEDAIVIREQINDLRKVIMYMGIITSNYVNRSFIVKCPDAENDRLELFLIRNGKTIKNLTYPISLEDEDEFQNLIGILYDVYFTENLFTFNSDLYKDDLTIENIYELNIITNWILMNNFEKYIYLVDNNPNMNEIIKFIFNKSTIKKQIVSC